MSTVDFDPFAARILWIDFETTGPDPDTSEPLEAAILYTTGKGELLHEAQTVFDVPEGRLRSALEPWAESTHARNGLLSELRSTGRRWPAAHVWLPTTIAPLLDPMGPFTKDVVPANVWFGGNNPQFDWRIFRRFCPTLVRMLGYRRVDTGTLSRVAKMAGVRVPHTDFGRHRASSDIRHSLDVYRWSIERFKGA